MKMKGKFEKQRIEVGLSEVVPLAYSGAEEKYTLAEHVAPRVTSIKFEKRTFEFELAPTSDDLPEHPVRSRCYAILEAMPVEALPEIEEELNESYRHYIAIDEVQRAAATLPPPQTSVIATVVRQLRT